MVAEALDSFVAQSGFDLTNEAIHRTCHERENKTIINCVAYIGSILRNWRNQNFRSLKDIELYDPYLFAEGTVKEFDFVIPIHGPWD
jgi:DnaD/phage-associated family protein